MKDLMFCVSVFLFLLALQFWTDFCNLAWKCLNLHQNHDSFLLVCLPLAS